MGAPSADWAIIFVFDVRFTVLIKALNQFLKMVVICKGFLEKNLVSSVSWVSGIM